MYLGEIIIPENVANWVPLIRYVPRPPIQIRGGLDPYGQERKRAVYLAEESVWKQIVPLQAETAQLERRVSAKMEEYNRALQDLENLTGKKSGLSPMVGGYAGIALNIIPLYRWISIGKMIFSLVSGLLGGNKKKKQQVQAAIDRLKRIQDEIRGLASAIEAIQQRITELVAGPLRLIEQQKVKMAEDISKSEVAYATAQAKQRAEGQAHANRARLYEQLYPSRQVRDVPL